MITKEVEIFTYLGESSQKNQLALMTAKKDWPSYGRNAETSIWKSKEITAETKKELYRVLSIHSYIPL